MRDRQNIPVDHAPPLTALQALPASSEQQSQEVRAGGGSDLKVRTEQRPAKQRPAKPTRDERREAAQSLARARWAEWARKKAG